MNARLFAILAGAAVAVTGIAASADEHIERAIDTRQGQFKLFAFNIGPLAQMAQGDIPYDADRAEAAAANLAALTGLHQDGLWPEGSDNASVDGTRALPVIWDNLDDFADKLAAANSAVLDLEAVAGDGLDAVRANLGPVGNACSACHDNYRAEQ